MPTYHHYLLLTTACLLTTYYWQAQLTCQLTAEAEAASKRQVLQALQQSKASLAKQRRQAEQAEAEAEAEAARLLATTQVCCPSTTLVLP